MGESRTSTTLGSLECGTLKDHSATAAAALLASSTVRFAPTVCGSGPLSRRHDPARHSRQPLSRTNTSKFYLSSAEYAMEKEARDISPEIIKVLAGTADLAVKIGNPSGKSSNGQSDGFMAR